MHTVKRENRNIGYHFRVSRRKTKNLWMFKFWRCVKFWVSGDIPQWDFYLIVVLVLGCSLGAVLHLLQKNSFVMSQACFWAGESCPPRTIPIFPTSLLLRSSQYLPVWFAFHTSLCVILQTLLPSVMSLFVYLEERLKLTIRMKAATNLVPNST